MNKILVVAMLFALVCVPVLASAEQVNVTNATEPNFWVYKCENKTLLKAIYQTPILENGSKPIYNLYQCPFGCDLNNDICFAPPKDESGTTIFLLTMTNVAVPLLMVAILVLFLWPPLEMRLKMMGRKNKGYMVFYILNKAGKKVPFVHKAEASFDIGNMQFKPKYEAKYMYRNEFDYPAMDFDARNINPDDKDKNSKKAAVEPMERPEGTKSITPEELLQMNMGFFKAGLLKGNIDFPKLMNMIFYILIANIVTIMMVLGIILKVYGIMEKMG